MRNAQIIDSAATLTSLTLSKRRGLAYFDALGRLLASEDMALDANGHLKLKDVFSDVNLRGNTLKNATISGSNLMDIYSAKIDRLFVGHHRDGLSSLAYFGPDGEIMSTSSVHFDVSKNSIKIEKLEGFKLIGPADFDNQTVSNIVLRGGDIKVAKVSTFDLHIDSLAHPDGKSVFGLVIANGRGVLSRTGGDEVVEANNLALNNLTLRGSLNCQGNTIKNAKLDADSIDFGKPQYLEVGNLIISQAGKDVSSNSKHVLSVDNEGLVHSSAALKLSATGTLSVNAISSLGSVEAASISVTSLASVEGASIVTTNSLGKFSTTEKVRLRSIISDEISLSPDGRLILGNIVSSIPSLLAVDSSGVVVSAQDMTTKAFDLGTLNVDILTAKDIITTRAEFATLILRESEASKLNRSGTLRMLAVTHQGEVVPSDNMLAKDIIASSLVVSGSVALQTLFIKQIDVLSPTYSALKTTLLTTNIDGQVQGVDSISVDSVYIRRDLDVISTASFNKLMIKSLAAEDSNDDFILIISSVGAVKKTMEPKVTSLSAVDVVVGKQLTTNSLKITGLAKPEQSGALLTISPDGNGLVQAIKDVKVDSIISVGSASFGGSLTAASITVKNMARPISFDWEGASGVESIVVASANGTLLSMSASSLISKVIKTLPQSNSVQYMDIRVTNDLHATKLHISGVESGGLLVSNELGTVSIVPVLPMLKATKVDIEKDLTIQGLATIKSLIVGDLIVTGGKEENSKLIVTNRDGKLKLVRNVGIDNDGTITARLGKFAALAGSVAAEELTLTGVELKSAKIDTMSLFLPPSEATSTDPGDVLIKLKVGQRKITT